MAMNLLQTFFHFPAYHPAASKCPQVRPHGIDRVPLLGCGLEPLRRLEDVVHTQSHVAGSVEIEVAQMLLNDHGSLPG